MSKIFVNEINPYNFGNTVSLSGSLVISGSHPTGYALEVEGDISASGTITAKQFHIEQITSSVIFEGGSSQFGDTLDDVHSFSGSITSPITASHDVSGSSTGSFAHVYVANDLDVDGVTLLESLSVANITASGIISASGGISASNLMINGPGITHHMIGVAPAIQFEDTLNDFTVTMTGDNGHLQINLDGHQSQDFSVATNKFPDNSGTPARAHAAFYIDGNTGEIAFNDAKAAINDQGVITASSHISSSGDISGESLIGAYAITASGGVTASGTGSFGSLFLGSGNIDIADGNRYIFNGSAGTANILFNVGQDNQEIVTTKGLSIKPGGGGFVDAVRLEGDVTMSDSVGHNYHLSSSGDIIASASLLSHTGLSLETKGSISASGHISASKLIASEIISRDSTGVFMSGNITASGDISSSGTIRAKAFSSDSDDSDIDFSGSIDVEGSITASGGITASARILGLEFQSTETGFYMNFEGGTGQIMAIASQRLDIGNVVVPKGMRLFGKNIDLDAPVTASSNLSVVGELSASATVTASILKVVDGAKMTFDTGSGFGALPHAGRGNTQGDIVKFGDATTVPGAIYAFTGSSWSMAHSGSNGGASSSLAVAIGTNSTTDGMLLRGFTKLNNPFAIEDSTPGGAPLYLEAPGSASSLPTETSTHVARVIGFNYSTTAPGAHDYNSRQVYFCPDNTWVVK